MDDGSTSLSELSPLHNIGDARQCSDIKEHCFLCESVDAEGSDGNAEAIRAFVRELVHQKKELPFVVNAVSQIYKDQSLGSISWSNASIRRHLLFSTEFDGLFVCVVDQMFIALITRIQSRMIDEAGGIDDTARKAFLETVDAMKKWKKGTAPPPPRP